MTDQIVEEQAKVGFLGEGATVEKPMDAIRRLKKESKQALDGFNQSPGTISPEKDEALRTFMAKNDELLKVLDSLIPKTMDPVDDVENVEFASKAAA